MPNPRKTTLWIFCFVLLATTLLFAVAPLALATSHQTAPPPDTGKGFLQSLGKSFALPPLALVNVVLYIVENTLIIILGMVAYILDSVFQANVQFNPANMQVVRLGWTIMRDLANSAFILIILWIAFTIIFELEQYGGKKLLTRVILIALFINFSLAMVAGLFGFTNAVAKAFQSKLPPRVGDYIVGSLKIQTIHNQLTPAQAAELAKASDQKVSYVCSTGGPTFSSEADCKGSCGGGQCIQKFGGVPGGISPPTWKDTALASLGFPQAQAQLTGAITGCVMGAIVGSVVGCVVGGAVGAIAQIFFRNISEYFDILTSLAVRSLLAILILLVSIAALSVGSITLLFRLMMMIFLSVLAPGAFLFAAIPGNHGKKYWDLWLNTLLKWAFFAPIFYFLFYLGLYMIGQMGGSGQRITNITADTDRFFGVIIAAGFIGASVFVAKKTGGALTDTVIKVGSLAAQAGLAYATAGASLGAGALLRRAAPTIEPALQRISQVSPLLMPRFVKGALTRGPIEMLERQKKEVGEARKEYAGRSGTHLAENFRGATLAKDQVAIALELAGKNSFHLLNDREKKRALQYTAQYNPEWVMDLLKADPKMATLDRLPERQRNALIARTQQQFGRAATDADAVSEVMGTVQNKEKLTPQMYQDQNGNVDNRVIRAILTKSDTGDFTRIAAHNPDLKREMEQYLRGLNAQQLTDLEREMIRTSSEQLRKYFSGVMSHGIGQRWDAPAVWRIPPPGRGGGGRGGGGPP